MQIYFGQNLVCVDSLSQEKRKTIKVGDPVYVIKMVSSYVDASVWDYYIIHVIIVVIGFVDTLRID